MIVFDVVVNGQIQETLTPVNQRLRDMQHYLFDRIEELKIRYNSEFELYRRLVH